MANLILYKDGAYNLYTTIAYGACYESALTLEQLEQVIRIDHGEQGMRDLPARLERAHKGHQMAWAKGTGAGNTASLHALSGRSDDGA